MDCQSHDNLSSAYPQLQNRPKKYAAPSEWESLRGVIKSLYLEQNKTLKEVRQIMAKDHGFHATQVARTMQYPRMTISHHEQDGNVQEEDQSLGHR